MLNYSDTLQGHSLLARMWSPNLIVDGRTGVLLTSKVHILSDPMFCTLPRATGTDDTSCWAKIVPYVWRNYLSENDFNIAGDPVDIHAH